MSIAADLFGTVFVKELQVASIGSDQLTVNGQTPELQINSGLALGSAATLTVGHLNVAQPYVTISAGTTGNVANQIKFAYVDDAVTQHANIVRQPTGLFEFQDTGLPHTLAPIKVKELRLQATDTNNVLSDTAEFIIASQHGRLEFQHSTDGPFMVFAPSSGNLTANESAVSELTITKPVSFVDMATFENGAYFGADQKWRMIPDPETQELLIQYQGLDGTWSAKSTFVLADEDLLVLPVGPSSLNGVPRVVGKLPDMATGLLLRDNATLMVPRMWTMAYASAWYGSYGLNSRAQTKAIFQNLYLVNTSGIPLTVTDVTLLNDDRLGHTRSGQAQSLLTQPYLVPAIGTFDQRMGSILDVNVATELTTFVGLSIAYRRADGSQANVLWSPREGFYTFDTVKGTPPRLGTAPVTTGNYLLSATDWNVAFASRLLYSSPMAISNSVASTYVPSTVTALFWTNTSASPTTLTATCAGATPLLPDVLASGDSAIFVVTDVTALAIVVIQEGYARGQLYMLSPSYAATFDAYSDLGYGVWTFSTTPLPPPGAPVITGFYAMYNGEALIQFTVASGIYPPRAIQYVATCTSSSNTAFVGRTFQATPGSSLGHIPISGMAQGEYIFTVTASIGGASATSLPSTTYEPQLPPAPSVVATKLSAGRIQVVVESTDSSNAQSFTITPSDGEVVTTTDWDDAYRNKRTVAFDYTTPGPRTFSVTATDVVGTSAATTSNEVTLSVPGAPTFVSVSKIATGRAQLSMQSPDDGTYTISWTEAGVSEGSTTVTRVSGTTYADVDFTTPGTRTFVVTVSNAVGTSEAVTTDPVTFAVPAATPVIESVTQTAPGRVSVAFSYNGEIAALPTSESDYANFEVSAYVDGNLLASVRPTDNSSVGGASPIVLTAHAGTFTYKVRALNAVGASADSAPSSSVTVVGPPACTGTITNVREGGPDLVVAIPDAAAYFPTHAITGWRVSFYTATWTYYPGETGPYESELFTYYEPYNLKELFRRKGMPDGMAYHTVRIITYNDAGSASATLDGTHYLETLPGPPTQVSVVATDVAMRVSFTPPTELGWGFIDSEYLHLTTAQYVVTVGGTEYLGTAPYIDVTGLTAGTRAFTVTTRTVVGDAVSSSVNGTVPSAPTAPTLSVLALYDGEQRVQRVTGDATAWRLRNLVPVEGSATLPTAMQLRQTSSDPIVLRYTYNVTPNSTSVTCSRSDTIINTYNQAEVIPTEVRDAIEWLNLSPVALVDNPSRFSLTLAITNAYGSSTKTLDFHIHTFIRDGLPPTTKFKYILTSPFSEWAYVQTYCFFVCSNSHENNNAARKLKWGLEHSHREERLGVIGVNADVVATLQWGAYEDEQVVTPTSYYALQLEPHPSLTRTSIIIDYPIPLDYLDIAFFHVILRYALTLTVQSGEVAVAIAPSTYTMPSLTTFVDIDPATYSVTSSSPYLITGLPSFDNYVSGRVSNGWGTSAWSIDVQPTVPAAAGQPTIEVDAEYDDGAIAVIDVTCDTQTVPLSYCTYTVAVTETQALVALVDGMSLAAIPSSLRLTTASGQTASARYQYVYGQGVTLGVSSVRQQWVEFELDPPTGFTANAITLSFETFRVALLIDPTQGIKTVCTGLDGSPASIPARFMLWAATPGYRTGIPYFDSGDYWPLDLSGTGFTAQNAYITLPLTSVYVTQDAGYDEETVTLRYGAFPDPNLIVFETATQTGPTVITLPPVTALAPFSVPVLQSVTVSLPNSVTTFAIVAGVLSAIEEGPVDHTWQYQPDPLTVSPSTYTVDRTDGLRVLLTVPWSTASAYLFAVKVDNGFGGSFSDRVAATIPGPPAAADISVTYQMFRGQSGSTVLYAGDMIVHVNDAATQTLQVYAGGWLVPSSEYSIRMWDNNLIVSGLYAGTYTFQLSRSTVWGTSLSNAVLQTSSLVQKYMQIRSNGAVIFDGRVIATAGKVVLVYQGSVNVLETEPNEGTAYTDSEGRGLLTNNNLSNNVLGAIGLAGSAITVGTASRWFVYGTNVTYHNGSLWTELPDVYVIIQDNPIGVLNTHKYLVDFTYVSAPSVLYPAVSVTYGEGHNTVYTARQSSDYPLRPGYELIQNWAFDPSAGLTSGVVFSNNNKTVTGDPTVAGPDLGANDYNVIRTTVGLSTDQYAGKYVFSMDWTWGGEPWYDIVGVVNGAGLDVGVTYAWVGSGNNIQSVGISDNGFIYADDSLHPAKINSTKGAASALHPGRVTLDLYIDTVNFTMFRTINGQLDANTPWTYTVPAEEDGIDISDLAQPCFFVRSDGDAWTVNTDNAPSGFQVNIPNAAQGSYTTATTEDTVIPMTYTAGTVYVSFTRNGNSTLDMLCGVYDGGEGYQSGNRLNVLDQTYVYVTRFGGCKHEDETVFVADGSTAVSDRIDLAVDTVNKLFWYRIAGGNWNSS